MLTPRQKVIIYAIFTGYMACVIGFILSIVFLYVGLLKIIAFNVHLIEVGWLDTVQKLDKYNSAALYSLYEIMFGMFLGFVSFVICRIIILDIEYIKKDLEKFDAEANKKRN